MVNLYVNQALINDLTLNLLSFELKKTNKSTIITGVPFDRAFVNWLATFGVAISVLA